MIIRLEWIWLFNTNTKEEVSVYLVRVTESYEVWIHIILTVGKKPGR